MDFATAQQLLHYITRDKSILYILCQGGIGDILINGGLCHALLKKKRKKVGVLILQDRYLNSGSINFVGVSEVQYIPQILLKKAITQYIYASGEYETDNYIYGDIHVDKNGYVWNEKLSNIDRYKENVFGLPLDTELIPPLIEPPTDSQKQNLHETHVLDKDRTIILAPYANSIANLKEAFWARLAAELIGKGYVLYTNVADPQEKVIAGTTPMRTTFSELMYLAEHVKCFIGLRSGIFDLLAFTNAKLLYINPKISWWQYDLNINFRHINSRAFYIASAAEWTVIKDFIQKNNLDSINNLIFNDIYVRGKDVAFDGCTLIKMIVSEVDG